MNHIDDKRTAQRIQVEVPIYIGQEKAVTRDISRSGIYFLMDRVPFEEGCVVLNFSLDFAYALPGQSVRVDCHGEVLRIEKHGDRYGVAARINDFHYLH